MRTTAYPFQDDTVLTTIHISSVSLLFITYYHRWQKFQAYNIF